MRYALAYPDPISMELVRAITRSGSHQVTGAYLSGNRHDELHQSGIATLPGTATAVLGLPQVDAVIVGEGGTPAARSELARTLVQAEMPMVVVHPVGDMLFGFELQMAQVSTDTPILPYSRELYHPVWEKVAAWIRQLHATPGPRIHQVQLDRLTTERDSAAVEALFCRDALLLRALFGRIIRISALRAWSHLPGASMPTREPANPPSAGTVPQSWSVQMLDDLDRDIRWNLQFASRDGAELTIHAEHESCKVTMVPDPNAWSCTIGGHRESLGEGSESMDPGAGALATMAAALQSKAGRKHADELWEHACRSVELADAVVRSSRRGRAIDLYHEEHSEENTFKGVMAAGGCIALFMALAAIPLVAIGERLLPDAEPGSRWLRLPWVFLFVILAAFLALQLLRLAIKRT